VPTATTERRYSVIMLVSTNLKTEGTLSALGVKNGNDSVEEIKKATTTNPSKQINPKRDFLASAGEIIILTIGNTTISAIAKPKNR
jgi:hypothetical protein